MGKQFSMPSPEPGDGSDEILTIKQAAAYLKIGRSSIFNLLNSGRLAYVRPVPGRRAVWKSDLVNFVNKSRVSAA